MAWAAAFAAAVDWRTATSRRWCSSAKYQPAPASPSAATIRTYTEIRFMVVAPSAHELQLGHEPAARAAAAGQVPLDAVVRRPALRRLAVVYRRVHRHEHDGVVAVAGDER